MRTRRVRGTRSAPSNPTRLVALSLGLLSLVACGPRRPADPGSADRKSHVERGLASWYGKKFHGRSTASGARFDMHRQSAAHRTLPFGTRVNVTNLENGLATVVVINDRGPFVDGRIIDLSRAAAKELDMIQAGVAQVEIEVIEGPGP